MNTKMMMSGVAMILALTGCAHMSAQDQCTIGGAVIGGVTGSVLSSGSGVGTVGGAAVGGVVGHQVGRDGRCP
ncbi:MAG: glycine zipper 2TM domain-containing protein [Sulfuricella sp.]